MLAFWGFQFHLFDIWTTVLLGMSDYREAWSGARFIGLSYFDLNVAVAFLFLLYALGLGLRSLAAHPASTLRNAWQALAYATFVVGFSYRLFFLSQNALNDDWWAKAIADEPWDRSGSHVGSIVGSIESQMATVVLDSTEEIVLHLPNAEPRYRVLIVHEFRTRYTRKVRYEAGRSVAYDDLDLFLRNWAALRTAE